jgi:hypothetical protein
MAVGAACVVGVAGTTASAEPTLPQPAQPVPATVTQTVTVQAVAPQLPAAQPGAPQPIGLSVAAPPAPAPETIAPAPSVTIVDFLKSKNVTLEPQHASDFRALNIVLPMPTGWAQVPDPNVPDAFAVTADRTGAGDGLYTSNAALVVYKLHGDFDPKEAISHGLIDSQQEMAWRSTDASLADFNGMPSSLIEGTFRQNNMTLNTSRRHVIATVGADRYLVSLAVTTSANVTVATGAATDAVVNGFRVSVPGAPAPAPAAAPLPPQPVSPPAAVPGAGQPLNQLVGLPR